MSKFTWGNAVQISNDAPASVRRGGSGVVVGVSEQAERHGSYLDRFPHGVVYTVEFEDGSDADVCEDDLVLLPD